MTTAAHDASKMARSGDTVFKPVNAQDQVGQRSPARDSTSPCTPPPPSAPSSGTSDPLKVCDTPHPDKTPSENGIGQKRAFGFVDSSASEAETAMAEEEQRTSRPSRHSRDMAIKKMRADGAAEDGYSTDRATSSRDTRRQADARPPAASPTKTATPADRSKGPCSYEQCPNPNHSSGGGFKVVSHETKAGNRDWSCYAGRTFCNACFTQYATRGTLQRPGRLLPSTSVAPPAPANTDHHPATEGVARPARDAPLVSMQPVRVRTTVEVDEEVEDTQDYVMHLQLTCLGPDVEYEWLHDGRPISGAVNPTLVVNNPRGLVGEITCRVRNGFGQVPPFAPVRLPLSIAEAQRRYAEPALPAVSSYALRCVCGVVREGSAEELVRPCACGLECCGTVDIRYADGSQGVSEGCGRRGRGTPEPGLDMRFGA
uniref:Ig-like domain-containing protein n=1 Tax=Hemiselmis andersenii TaxID=464988 RepID=A0A6U4VLM6_HEMAN|mmetsp:Transcript_9152/g.21352  ORF Transcript_9152/g.21352 Transcript_9152/m.21352 type:complete len:428 (+) Transcript_9152:539-1822(+)